MKIEPSAYHGFRFPAEIISHAVWLYHCFCLSLREVETILAQRGIVVSYESTRGIGVPREPYAYGDEVHLSKAYSWTEKSIACNGANPPLQGGGAVWGTWFSRRSHR